MRIGGGLLDEPLHTRRERVVRVMHEDVALLQGVEHVRRVGRLDL
jgi:hypothetical protein